MGCLSDRPGSRRISCTAVGATGTTRLIGLCFAVELQNRQRVSTHRVLDAGFPTTAAECFPPRPPSASSTEPSGDGRNQPANSWLCEVVRIPAASNPIAHHPRLMLKERDLHRCNPGMGSRTVTF